MAVFVNSDQLHFFAVCIQKWGKYYSPFRSEESQAKKNRQNDKIRSPKIF